MNKTETKRYAATIAMKTGVANRTRGKWKERVALQQEGLWMLPCPGPDISRWGMNLPEELQVL
jgi:hypothetical protein